MASSVIDAEQPFILDTGRQRGDGTQSAQQQDRQIVGEPRVGGVTLDRADDGGADRRTALSRGWPCSAVSRPLSSNGTPCGFSASVMPSL